MRSCAAEVTLGTVSVDSNVQAPRGSLGIVLAVGLEGVDESVGSIIGLLELIGLNLRRLFESLSGLEVYNRIVSAVVSDRMPRQSGKGILCCCILKALAAWVKRSAASWYLSSRPPKKLKPPPAL